MVLPLNSSKSPITEAMPSDSNWIETCLTFAKASPYFCSRSTVFFPLEIYDSPMTFESCSRKRCTRWCFYYCMQPFESRVTAFPPSNFIKMWVLDTKSICSISWSYWKPTMLILREPGAGLTTKQNSLWSRWHWAIMLVAAYIPCTLYICQSEVVSTSYSSSSSSSSSDSWSSDFLWSCERSFSSPKKRDGTLISIESVLLRLYVVSLKVRVRCVTCTWAQSLSLSLLISASFWWWEKSITF